MGPIVGGRVAAHGLEFSEAFEAVYWSRMRPVWSKLNSLFTKLFVIVIRWQQLFVLVNKLLRQNFLLTLFWVTAVCTTTKCMHLTYHVKNSNYINSKTKEREMFVTWNYPNSWEYVHSRNYAHRWGCIIAIRLDQVNNWLLWPNRYSYNVYTIGCKCSQCKCSQCDYCVRNWSRMHFII